MSRDHAHAAQLQLATLVLGLGILASLATSIYPTIAVGAGRVDVGITVGVTMRLAAAAAQIVAVLASKNVVVLASVTSVGFLGTTLAVREVTRRLFREIEVRLALARRRTALQLLGSGWRNAAIVIAAAFALQSDSIVVGAILGTAAVASYGIATRGAAMAIGLATRSTDVLVPTYAHAGAVNDHERITGVLSESILIARALLVGAAIAFVFFGDSLLRLWLGTVPSRAGTVLVFLILGAVVQAPGHSCYMYLSGVNRLNYLLVGGSIAAAGNLGLSILLTWRFGVVGPALGSLVFWVVWDCLLLPRHVSRLLNIPWHSISAAGLRILAAPALAGSVAAWILGPGLGWDTPRKSLAATLVLGIVYGGVLVATLGSQRRASYWRLTRGALRRAPTAEES